MSIFSFDAGAADFEREVIEASKSVPVVVDFWAPWCAPCRALKPILEKLASEYGGRFRLARVNTDENPELAARYGVRGIPNVKAFANGRLVDQFTGALPESAVRAFIDSLIPSESERLRLAAQEDIARGDLDAAEAKLGQAIDLDAGNHVARIDLAELLMTRQDFPAADAALAAVPEHLRDDRAEMLAAKLSFWKKGQQLPDQATLQARILAQPDDFGARLSYAERLVAEGQYQPALDELVQIVQRDRGATREQARKAAVDVFNLAGDQPDLVSEYRRRLSAALY